MLICHRSDSSTLSVILTLPPYLVITTGSPKAHGVKNEKIKVKFTWQKTKKTCGVATMATYPVELFFFIPFQIIIERKNITVYLLLILIMIRNIEVRHSVLNLKNHSGIFSFC